MTAFLSRAWRQQPQYPVDPNPEWRAAFNAATSPQSTDSTGVHWRLQGTTNDWLNRARVVLPPHGIAFQAEQFYGGDDSISGVHSGGAGYLFPREQGTMVVLGRVVTPFAYQPAIAVSNGALLRGDIDETWFQVGGNIWTTGQAWSTTMDGLFAVALTWGAFGRRLYRGGRLLASTSTAPSATAHSGTLNVGGDGIRYWMCAISGDVLDAGSLSENPWQVFRPRTARIYSFPSGGGGSHSVSPSGIASAEAFGTPSISVGAVPVAPGGIASAEAHGSTTVAPGAVSVAPGGIATEEAHGSHSLAVGAVTVAPGGVASAEAIGDATISAGATLVAPGGVAALEAHGAHSLSVGAVSVAPGGVASAEAFGSHTLTQGATVAPDGIGTAELVGSHSLAVGAVSVAPAGIATDEAHGSHVVSAGASLVVVTGIESAEAHGAHALTQAQAVAPGGVASLEAHGSHSLATGAAIVNPPAIASTEAIGAASVLGGLSAVGWLRAQARLRVALRAKARARPALRARARHNNGG